MRTLLVAREEAKSALAARVVDTRGRYRAGHSDRMHGRGDLDWSEADRFGGMVFMVEVGKKEMQFPLFGDVRKLVTHWFTIEDAVSVVQTRLTSADPKRGAIKVQITNHKS